MTSCDSVVVAKLGSDQNVARLGKTLLLVIF